MAAQHFWLARRPSRTERRERMWGLIFLAPWIAGFLLFFAGPMVASLIFSFTDFNLLTPASASFVGLANWLHMLRDPNVRQALWVTGRFLAITVPLFLLLPLLLALLLNSRYLLGKRLFRTLFYLPTMVPAVAATMIWFGVLNPETGWVERLLSLVGLHSPDWFSNPLWIMPALGLIGTWGIGNTMVIMLAGLQGVPTELYEAARVDGAGPLRSLFVITLPLISPVIFYNLVLAVIGGFQYFLGAYILNAQTNGAGPNNVSLFYMVNLYREAFVYYNMGYASTLAWGMFIVALLITSTLFATANRWVYYAAGEE